MKTCRTCKYCDYDSVYPKCTNPIFPKEVDVVSGELKSNYCSTLRLHSRIPGYSYGLCGKDGEHWEKRLSLWEKLVSLFK